MRLASLLAVIAIAQNGCFPARWSPTAHKAAYVADGAVAVLGVVGLFSSCPPPPDDLSCDVPPQAAGVVFLGGAVIAAVINMLLPGEPPPPPPPSPAELDRLAVDATTAARLGDCGAARDALQTIFHADPARFDHVVAGEPALARCLLAD